MNALDFIFQGKCFTASKGDSVAAALLNAGEYVLGERINGEQRGAFCGMGVCNECLVTINGQRGFRACMQIIKPGDVIEKESDRRHAILNQKINTPKRLNEHAEILIVGAGPAGLTAAIKAKAAGVDVVVLDDREEPGGQYYKPRSIGFRGFHGLDRQHREGNRLREKAQKIGVRIYSGQTVWYARKEKDTFEIRSVSENRQFYIKALSVILCTGAFEVPKIIPGWTLPGVVTIGAAQTMVRRYGVIPSGKVLIAGNGPLGLQLAHEILRLGPHNITLAEKAAVNVNFQLLKAAFYSPRLMVDGAIYRWNTFKSKTSVLYNWEIEAILGTRRVESALLSNLKTKEKRKIPCEFIAAGEGFSPQTELSRLLGVPVKIDPTTKQITPIRNSDCSTIIPNLWIAGDAGGIGGAVLAGAQGEIAALGAIYSLSSKKIPRKINAVQKKVKRATGFQNALWSIYSAQSEVKFKDNLILCRCEQISNTKIEEVVSGGISGLAAIKRITRLGMGRCQGRYCIPEAIKLLETKGISIKDDGLFAPQVPARPVNASSIWLEKPEWKGHKKADLPSRPQRLSSEPLSHSKADLVVIGGGVTGVATSYFAAKEGATVICLEKGQVNSEASGGNAGSLHAQLLSWDFGTKAVGDGELQLRTLPLQQESVELWKSLQTKFHADFEIELTGGLMVAETEQQVRFLEEKVKAESRVGVATKLINKDDILKIIPGISSTVLAGSWCAEEGKINPLVSTPILANEAIKQGAIIEELTEVTGLKQDDIGYEIKTNRGIISTKKLLICAGGWTSELFKMLGINIPINGAPLQMIVTTPAPKIVNCLMYHAGRHLTMKQSNTGSIIIGGAWPASVSSEGRSIVLPDSIEGNLWAAGQTIPSIADVQILRSWGAMNIDIDGAPLIGKIPGFDGLLVAATANGYTLGPVMGKEAARIALNGNVRQDLNMFSISRFN